MAISRMARTDVRIQQVFVDPLSARNFLGRSSKKIRLVKNGLALHGDALGHLVRAGTGWAHYRTGTDGAIIGRRP